MTYMNQIEAVAPAIFTSDLPRAAQTGEDRFDHVRLFGLPVVSATTGAVIRRLLVPGRASRVAFLNAHCANVMSRDAAYRDALCSADMILPHGIGVELAARMRGEEIRENLNGTDFVPALLAEAARRGLGVYLLGGRLDARITLGVGALFDFLAGEVRRAPRLVRKARSEWLWRLAMEPRRMAGRYLLGNASFLLRAAADAFRSRDRLAVARRAIDVTLSGLALLSLMPLFLLLAAAIRLESPGPVLFRQTRIGRDGRPFTMLKFRSMYRDAEARRAALLSQSDREGVCFKARNDPRITRVGRFLRRYSIDEMPQILNVLRGEMAIVGPRPALPEEVAAYPERALGRLAVKPGLTGIWQVSGRAEIGFDKMIDMDLAYVNARSILLDIVLVFMTFRAVVGGRGAY